VKCPAIRQETESILILYPKMGESSFKISSALSRTAANSDLARHFHAAIRSRHPSEPQEKTPGAKRPGVESYANREG